MASVSGYIGTMPQASYASYFIPASLRTRWIYGGGRINRKAPDRMYSPTGRVCLVRHARTQDQVLGPVLGPDKPAVCRRPGCEQFIMSTDLRRKVCAQCRTS